MGGHTEHNKPHQGFLMELERGDKVTVGGLAEVVQLHQACRTASCQQWLVPGGAQMGCNLQVTPIGPI